MRAFVFTDKALARHAGQFVWLEIDTENAKNAALRKKYPIPALPTFFVIDPRNETVVLRWVGGATLPQLVTMLDDARTKYAGGVATGGSAPAEAALARADSSYGTGRNGEAAAAYLAALELAPAGWPRYSRTVESALFALSQVDSNATAAQLAAAEYPRLAHTPSAANVAATGLDCALSMPADHPQRRALIDSLESATRAVVADRTLRLAADDRSGAYIALLDARADAKDDAGGHQVASEWATFLEGEAARATTPDGRAVFDSHRLSAYLQLDQPERAIPMLEQSERDFPNDYNPPARLATAYKAMKQWKQALAASDRAMPRAYGPRKLLLLQTRSDIFKGLGDAASARRTLEEAVATAEAFPPGQRSENTIANLKKKRDAMPNP
jgi:tetratricopeptide (TPR) repeat protein